MSAFVCVCVWVAEGIWTASNGQTITSMSQQMTIFTPTSKLPRPQDISPLSPCSFLHYPAPTRVVADDVSECGAVCVCVCVHVCVVVPHSRMSSHTHTHTHTRTAYERFFLSLFPHLAPSLSFLLSHSLAWVPFSFVSFCGHCGCCSTRRKKVIKM